MISLSLSPSPSLSLFPSGSDLPPLGSVMIKVYRENYNKKRREKTPATDIGKIEMPALILESGQLMEKWYIHVQQIINFTEIERLWVNPQMIS